MAESVIRKRLSQRLLKQLGANMSQSRQDSLQEGGGRPQVIYLENGDLEFINKAIVNFSDKISSGTKPIDFTEADYELARGIANEFQDRFFQRNKRYKNQPAGLANTAAGIWLFKNEPDTYNKILAGTAFVPGGWRTTGTKCKGKIIEAFITNTQDQFEIKSRTDLGHGAKDAGLAKSTIGAASAMAKVDAAARRYTKEDGTPQIDIVKLKQEFASYMRKGGQKIFRTKDLDITKEVDDIIDLAIDYSRVIDKNGKIKSDYVAILGFQDRMSNSGRGGDAEKEKEALAIARKFFVEEVGAGELISMQGSPSIEDQILSKTLSDFIEPLKKSGAKITLKIDPKVFNVPQKVKGKTRKESTKKGRATVKDVKPVMPTAPSIKRRQAKGTASPVNLIGLINAKLPQTVAKNMGAPRLENRTGRFASSPRVVDIQTTPQGFPSIGYTYEKQPYSVFERTSGTRFASAERDPRDLIELSIREIATQITIGRFYTRRL